MFSESKLGPLISFSWPLLKLKPQISPGCYGLHGPLITLDRAFLWREGKGWGLREVWGTTQAEQSPCCQLFWCTGKQAGALYSCRKSWCLTITDSRFVISWTCLSLTYRVAHGSLCCPGRNKALLLSGWTESQEKLTKCGIYSKVCGLKDEPLRTATSNLKTVFVTFANTYFCVEKFNQSSRTTQSHGWKAFGLMCA